MLTYLALIVLVPFALWVLGMMLDLLVERRYQSARERDREAAQTILDEWRRMGWVDDLDPEEVLREAERIVGRGRVERE